MSHSANSVAFDTENDPGLKISGLDGGVTGVASVSVVIPCFNEERFIGDVLSNLANQYPHERYEILVVDGGSTDGTRKVISDFASQNPTLRVRVIDNPKRNIPTALNLGIREARGELIVRMDAHSLPSAGYVRRCVELLSDNSVSVVGMPWHIKAGADSVMARAIALAVAHPFGIGDASYRLTSSPAKFVDTVPFGAFKKSLWETLKGFNENLLTNEDYDFNYRVRLSGGRVLLDTAAYCDYFARPSLRELASQYARYGWWKAQMVKLHPRSIRLRQLVAPAFVLYVIFCLVLIALWPGSWPVLLPAAAYLVLSLFFAASLAKKGHNWKLIVVIPLIFFIVHCSWGGSFLYGLVVSPGRANN